MTPDITAALAILERLREVARRRGQKGRPMLSRLRPRGSSPMKWMQSEPVRIASARLTWYGYQAATNRGEWLLAIGAAIEDLEVRAP